MRVLIWSLKVASVVGFGCVTYLAMAGQAAAYSVVPPVSPVVVETAFAPPLSRWGVGHRGVDLSAAVGQDIKAIADGVVIYAADLAGRPIISIKHGFVRSTYEPVTALVRSGQWVTGGQPIGLLVAGHKSCPKGCLHFGVKTDDGYLHPLMLLGEYRYPVLRPNGSYQARG
jgi:murein DD-endopeptidase MepM/ murein hydrolase activator NlpD